MTNQNTGHHRRRRTNRKENRKITKTRKLELLAAVIRYRQAAPAGATD